MEVGKKEVDKKVAGPEMSTQTEPEKTKESKEVQSEPPPEPVRECRETQVMFDYLSKKRDYSTKSLLE